MERYERKFWDLNSNIADAEARLDDLYNAMGVAEFNRLFPENSQMADEWSVIAKPYRLSGSVVPDEIRAQFEKKHADHLTKVREFYSERDELYDLIPMLRRREAEREEQEEKAKKEAWKREAYHGFLSNSTMMAAARADKALQKMVNFGPDGGVMTVADFVERHLAAGTLYAKAKAEKPSIDRRRWNRMTAEQQSDWEREHQKSVMRYSVNRYDLGKTAYGYAVYLSNLKK